MTSPLSPELCRLADACMKDARWTIAENTPAQQIKVHGPALVYTAWNGSSCGKTHDFDIIREAAKNLNIPLYVINSGEGALDETAPGEQIAQGNGSWLEALAHHGLFVEDRNIRLVNTNGDAIGSKVNTGMGLEAIEKTFAPLIAEMKPLQQSHATPVITAPATPPQKKSYLCRA